LAAILTLVSACGMLRLPDELHLLGSEYVLSGAIVNAADFDSSIRVIVLEREPDGRVASADLGTVAGQGTFAFRLDSPERHYVVAYADENGDEEYEPGEPAWVYTGAGNHPIPVEFVDATRRSRVVGRLSRRTRIPDDLVHATVEYRAGRPVEEVMRGQQIPLEIGEIADLDDDRFSTKRGQEGLWEPASFAMKSGVGIYFLEPYDEDRVPILFVHGAGGSPQDWRAIFDALDRGRFQPWFFFYPTGRRLDEMASWLDGSVEYLQSLYGIDRMAVVAHSMGGLVSRAFLNKHVATSDGNRGIRLFVTIATPWNGHDAAGAGINRSPVAIPSWYDLAPGSQFLATLFETPSPDLPPHYLLFTYRGSSSLVLPACNDGTVSLASQLRREAQADATALVGYDATHVGALRDAAVIDDLNRILAAELGDRQRGRGGSPWRMSFEKSGD
jgi:pimeloyl-ACP methyl ester carboxylesterase